jgi:nicotinate-nucleotide adenylyltransferase
MLQAALADNPAFELSRVEIDRPPPHYALDTVRILKERNPAAELIYLLGGDSLRDLPLWHRPREFVAACDGLGVMRRPNDAVDLPKLEQHIPGISHKIRFIAAPLLEISSSEIRQRVSQNRPFRYFLPPAVYAIIQEGRLYCDRLQVES